MDGPASVTVVSGVVEVFDSLVESKGKVVIREGKRLPFTAKETATLEISLGENASIEEVDESTIPLSWTEAYEQLLNFQNKPVVAMVIGTVDSGKTSFCTYLTNKLLHEKQKVAILDGDLGQSDIGPPCTVAYTYITKSVTDLFNLEAKNAFFIGVTSPSTAINKVIKGLTSLKKEILDTDPDFIVINTDGWVEGEDAVNYKVQLAKELNSEIIFCIQQKDELTPLLNSLEGFKKIVVESPSAIKQRSREKRRSLRELGYIKYLKNAKVQSLPIGWLKIEANEFLGLSTHHGDMKQARKVYDFLGMKPLHFAELKDRVYMVIGRSCWINDEKIKKLEEILGKKIVVIRKGEEEGLLVALYNNDRKFLGIGVLREIDYSRKTLKIFTPVSEGISIVALGRVKLDKNLKETPAFAEEA
ncbi:MAG: Clp1/GlmU family protein [Candidatus Bathyarchaeota archaeon]|nr:Clp1/GlmU family protein [Candidatus Bathyarchaeota archaeon]